MNVTQIKLAATELIKIHRKDSSLIVETNQLTNTETNIY